MDDRNERRASHAATEMTVVEQFLRSGLHRQASPHLSEGSWLLGNSSSSRRGWTCRTRLNIPRVGWWSLN